MLIKNVFDNLDDAIAYMKVCGACGAERIYYCPSDDDYCVNVTFNDYKFWETVAEKDRRIILRMDSPRAC